MANDCKSSPVEMPVDDTTLIPYRKRVLRAAADYEACKAIVERVPHAGHYQRDLDRAERELKASVADLDEAEDEAWIKFWFEQGEKRVSMVERIANGARRIIIEKLGLEGMQWWA